jgi:hypothetical protein
VRAQGPGPRGAGAGEGTFPGPAPGQGERDYEGRRHGCEKELNPQASGAGRGRNPTRAVVVPERSSVGMCALLARAGHGARAGDRLVKAHASAELAAPGGKGASCELAAACFLAGPHFPYRTRVRHVIM